MKIHRSQSTFSRALLSGCAVLVLFAAAGCSRPSMPNMPSLTGHNLLRDITKVKRGMSENEVRRVMGSRYQTVYPEGIDGIDGGNFVWDYAEGRIYFNNIDGVTRVVPSN